MDMAAEIAVGTPLAEELQKIVLPKLVEVGWSTGLQDDTLSEYIILMLANGKSQEQIAAELSNDLLDLGPENPEAISFSKWLFEQLHNLHAQLNIAGVSTTSNQNSTGAIGEGQVQPIASTDAEMGDVSGSNKYVAPNDHSSPKRSSPKPNKQLPSGYTLPPLKVDRMSQSLSLQSQLLIDCNSIPTGPKAQRNGNQKNRDKRMLGQLNKTLNQSTDAVLHRVRSTAGTGRINSHASRDPPKGPRNQQLQRNLAMTNGRGMPNMQNMPIPGMPGVPAMPNAQGMPFMSMEDQMGFYSQLSHMAMQMQTMTQAIAQSGILPPANQQGKSLFNRVDGRHNRPGSNKADRRHGNNTQQQGTVDTEMGEDVQLSQPTNGTAQASSEPSRTVCRFDFNCTKPDCPFAHHSPIASSKTVVEPIDMNTECGYGAACKNSHCTSRHPSRAKKFAHQAEQECTFGPFCKKYPNCPFKHPNKRACRNGADCQVEGCPYYHSMIECKHNPCYNYHCPYKHKDGQKQKYSENEEGKEHVSERKFVEDGADEEVILPGKENENLDVAAEPTSHIKPEAQVMT